MGNGVRRIYQERHAFVLKESRGGISFMQIALVENYAYVQTLLLRIDDRFRYGR
jgi:hypothetical protein